MDNRLVQSNKIEMAIDFDNETGLFAVFINHTPPVIKQSKVNLHAIFHECEYGPVVALVLTENGKTIADCLLNILENVDRLALHNLSEQSAIPVVYLPVTPLYDEDDSHCRYLVKNSKHHQNNLKTLSNLDACENAMTNWPRAVKSYYSQPKGIW